MGKLSRDKGARFERDVAKALREVFGEDEKVVRGFQSRGGGKEQADVICPIVHPECKVGARPNLKAALEQAESDAQPNKIPVAVCRWDGERDGVVAMRFSTWRGMLLAVWKAQQAGLVSDVLPMPLEDKEASK